MMFLKTMPDRGSLQLVPAGGVGGGLDRESLSARSPHFKPLSHWPGGGQSCLKRAKEFKLVSGHCLGRGSPLYVA